MAKIYEALENAQIEQLSRLPEISAPRSGVFPSPLVMEEGIRVYQNLATLLRDATKKVILFIGSREGEGTSTVVREFARVSARKFDKKVLLLDADQYHPSQHLFFDIQPEWGWQEVLRDQQPIDKALYQIGDTRLSISPSSQYSASNPENLNSLLIDIFWKKLRQRFDLILVDSPPATTSPDGLAMCSKVDGIILVVEAEKTRWPVAENTKNRILNSGGKILGIVLNKRRYYIPDWIYKNL